MKMDITGQLTPGVLDQSCFKCVSLSTQLCLLIQKPGFVSERSKHAKKKREKSLNITDTQIWHFFKLKFILTDAQLLIKSTRCPYSSWVSSRNGKSTLEEMLMGLNERSRQADRVEPGKTSTLAPTRLSGTLPSHLKAASCVGGWPSIFS